MSSLARMKCLACTGDVPRLDADEIAPLASQVPGWKVVEEHHLTRTIETEDFLEALDLANRIGKIAEKAGHHPDLLVRYGSLGIEIFTHKIDGLTKSDFILAAKVDEIIEPKKSRAKRRVKR